MVLGAQDTTIDLLESETQIPKLVTPVCFSYITMHCSNLLNQNLNIPCLLPFTT